MRQMYNPAHPGSVLREWLGEMQVSEAAAKLHVSRVTLSRILNGKAGISSRHVAAPVRCPWNQPDAVD